MSELDRIRALARLTHDRGLSREAAELVALALIPLDQGHGAEPVSRRFPKKIARRTDRFRKTAKSASSDVLVDLARKTIEDFFDLAVMHGEDYYIAKYGEATAGPALWAVESSDAEPGVASEPSIAEAVPDETPERAGQTGSG